MISSPSPVQHSENMFVKVHMSMQYQHTKINQNHLHSNKSCIKRQSKWFFGLVMNEKSEYM